LPGIPRTHSHPCFPPLFHPTMTSQIAKRNVRTVAGNCDKLDPGHSS
jgi:hypothetical protein